MNDPREEVIESADGLTDSSSDELADLQKEFEVRRQKILEKKLQKKDDEKKLVEKQIVRSPSPSSKSAAMIYKPKSNIISNLSGKTINLPKEDLQKGGLSITRNVNKEPSQFFSKLHQSSQISKKTVDYEKREFLFEIPELHDLVVDEKELFSALHLRKRYIKHEDLTKLFAEKKVLKVDKLYAKVTAPGYHEPDYANWCVIGVITNKSEPKLTKTTSNEKRSKYMKVTLGDLNLSVDLMIFGDAFKKYWKLRVGDIVAVLNPNVNPWKPPFNGFNLSINDGVDSILEIGSSRDFGHCSMVKKDQTRCDSVINILKSDLCNYHQEIKYKQSQNKRMELNGSVNLKSPTNKQGQKQSMYLSTNAKGKISGGYLNYEKINQQTTNYHYEGGKLEESFVNPKLLDNIQVKRRKHNDSKNNELLEKKLLKLLNNSNFKKLGLIKNNVNQPEPTVNKTAFNSSILNKIGFDPTSRQVGETIHKSPQKQRKELSTDLKELYEISSRKQFMRKLTSSKEDLDSKKNKWQTNLRTLEKYKQRYEEPSTSDPRFKDDTILQSPVRMKKRKIDYSDSDSDSEPGPRVHTGQPSRISKLLESQYHKPSTVHTNNNTRPTKSYSQPPKHAPAIRSELDSSDSDIEISFDSQATKENYNKIIRNSQ